MPDHFSLLLEWRRNEGATRGLAKLPHDFYSMTAAYLADVRRSYEADLRENPSGRKGDMSRQTYQRASQVARDIVEGRAQKVLAAAFQASIGGSRELPNALPDERAMYDRIVATLLDSRRRITPFLEMPAGVSAPATTPTKAAPSATAPVAPVPVAPSPSRAPGVPATTYVRVIKDGRPIEVGAETIDLRTEDILSLPEDKARLLVAAKVAEPIAPGSNPEPVT